MTVPHPVVHVDVRVPVAVTEQAFLQLAVQAATKKFREMQTQGSGCAEPVFIEPTELCRHSEGP